MEARNLRRNFKKSLEKAEISSFRYHDLRHTFASRLAMTGANDRTLQTLMGHQSPRMILRYAHLSPTHLREALEKLVDFSPKVTATDTKTETKEFLTIEGGKKTAEILKILERETGFEPATLALAMCHNLFVLLCTLWHNVGDYRRK